jgi:hypothetical protein
MRPSLSLIRFIALVIFLCHLSLSGIGQAHLDIIEKADHITLNEVIRRTEEYYSDKDKGKGSGYKQFKRWEYFHKLILRGDEDVKTFSLRRFEAMEARKQNRSNSRIGGPVTAGSWKEVGPLKTERWNYSGRINTVIVDPLNPAYIYAGSPAGGLWHSRDDGKTWKCITDNIYSFIGITSLVIDPKSPPENRTLYILTGDKDGDDTNYIGIFRSTDNGITWTKMPYQWDVIAGFKKLMMHPTDNTLLYLLANEVGVFQFKVGTSTQWLRKLSGTFTDMEFNPSTPSTMYVTGETGTFRSTNNGETWTKSTSVIPTSIRNEMAVTPANPSVVYLFLGQRDVASLYKSTDSGLTYAKVPSTFAFADVGAYQWHYNLAITVSPTDANIVFLGGINFYRSTNGGSNFMIDNMGHVDFHSLDYYHGALYAGNDGGITRRPKDAATGVYQDLSQGLAVGEIYKIGVDQSPENHVLAGFQDNGTASVVDDVARIFSEGDGMECFVDPVNHDNLFTSSQQGNFYKGSRSANNYHLINPPLGPRLWLSPFKMDPTNNKVIYVGYADIWKNTNQGDATWINISNGAMGSAPLENFEIAPSNSNVIYAAKDSKMFVTLNGGSTWKALTNSWTTNVINFAIHPENPSVIWTVNPYSHSQRPSVMKSVDAGTTWTDVSGFIPDVEIYSIVYQKGTNNGLYIGTAEGVYYKDDSMADWIRFDYGMPYSPITDLEINYKTGKLYCSTYGRGIWASDLYGNTASGCELVGKIRREVWSNISGTDVSAIPVNTPPTSISDLTLFESPSNTGSNFGSRIRGFVCVQITGDYTFWISSDDKSELWLSIDDDPAHKVKIASVSGYTSVRQWTKYATQQSPAITLYKGRKYYIEALHKEASGSDHLAVGWQLPDGVQERPIPGNRLVPFIETVNHPPVVKIISPHDGDQIDDIFVPVQTEASDVDNNLLKVGLYDGGKLVREDFTEPFNFDWSTTVEGTHRLRVVATDKLGLTDDDSIVVTITNPYVCKGSGTILREVWNNVTGTSVSDIPVNTPPTFTGEIPVFEIPSNLGSNYGTRVKGYICVPQSGEYIFWIASDDKSELWLNHQDPFTRSLIASVNGYTANRQWDKYPTQRSAPIYLEGGTTYIIEALHKEGSGQDHMAVGWQLPDGTQERPIPGSRLIPYDAESDNIPPDAFFLSPQDGDVFTESATIPIEIEAYDYEENGYVTRVELYVNDTLLTELTSEPWVYGWANVRPGNYALKVIAFDNYDHGGNESIITVRVESAGPCSAVGNIGYERWQGISGTSVINIPTDTEPSSRGTISSFEMPSNIGSDFGTRVRGYVCVPATGEYTFWIASDDNSELWLGADNTPDRISKIASVGGHTAGREWTKYTSQTSLPITLQAGKSYYIEALHKESSGVDHLAVGWMLPNGTLERPIPGSRLSPYNMGPASSWRGVDAFTEESDHDLSIFPNPYNDGALTVQLPNDDQIVAGLATVEIISTTGSVLRLENIQCEEECSVINIPMDKRLPAGIYVLQAILNRKRFRGKLMVE